MQKEININGKTYEYVNNIIYKGKAYVAYMDDDNVYISEYVINDDKIIFKDISKDIFDKIKDVMVL